MLVKIVKSGLFAEDYRTMHDLKEGKEIEVSPAFAARLIETKYAVLKEAAPKEDEVVEPISLPVEVEDVVLPEEKEEELKEELKVGDIVEIPGVEGEHEVVSIEEKEDVTEVETVEIELKEEKEKEVISEPKKSNNRKTK